MFGLRAGGIGVLNPANLVSFLVCPEPVEAPAEAWSAGDENGRCNGGCRHRPRPLPIRERQAGSGASRAHPLIAAS